MATHAPLGSKHPDIFISMAAGPLLFALVGAHQLAAHGIALGQASEEIFRGDRLPTLP
jgi:hypothetical protein